MTTIRGVSAATTRRTTQSEFPGKVKDAGWKPGSGVRPPNGGGAYMGLYVDALVNPLTTTKATAKLDQAKKTITITVQGKAGRPNQQADTLRDIHVASPRGMQIGQQYKLVVVDTAGHVLSRKNISTYPAA